MAGRNSQLNSSQNTRATGRQARSTARTRSSRAGRRPATRAYKGDRILLAALLFILLGSALLLTLAYTRYRDGIQNERNLVRIEQAVRPSDLEAVQSSAPSGEEKKANLVLADEIKVDDLSLGGMSLEDAVNALKQNEEKILSKLELVKLTGGPKSISKTPYQLGLRLDIDTLIAQAQEESGKLLGRNPLLKPRYIVDETALKEAVEAIRESIDQEGKDAEAKGFDANTMQFTFSKEQEGRKLDVQDLTEKLRAMLEKAEFGKELALKIERTPAGRTAAEMSAAMGLVASASTPILSYSEARNINVQLAADRIHGTIIQPGATFSYNATIGPMTEANGFVPAGIQDEFGNDALGIGGGLCQPSTTLYQAAVQAGMQIGAHSFHSTPVNYCPIGTDAMVSEWSDLTFTNPTPYPYTIMAYFDGATLAFNFYGPVNPDGITYGLYVEELEETPEEGEPRFFKDEKMAPGETEVRVQPRPSRHVKVFRKTYQNGIEIASELMYDHVYPGSTGVIAGNVESLPASTSEATTAEGEVPAAQWETVAEETREVLYYYTDVNGVRQPVYAPPEEP